MPSKFYVTIDGNATGQLAGETGGGSGRGAKGKLVGLGFSYEVRAPRDLATGQASGKRQHGPVTFTKEWGAASPELFSALVTNEILKTALFEFVHLDAHGAESVFHKIKLTNAAVTSIHQYIQLDSAGAPQQRALEDVALSFQKIEIENLDGKTAASDILSAPA